MICGSGVDVLPCGAAYLAAHVGSARVGKRCFDIKVHGVEATGLLQCWLMGCALSLSLCHFQEVMLCCITRYALARRPLASTQYEWNTTRQHTQ